MAILGVVGIRTSPKSSPRKITAYTLKFLARNDPNKSVTYETDQLPSILDGAQTGDVFDPDSPSDARYKVVEIEHHIRTSEHKTTQTYTLAITLEPVRQ